ncbi:hypothetical protein JQ031_12380 [Clostridium botulinum]|nr:hypothetical protein [Clostridium botulinum]
MNIELKENTKQMDKFSKGVHMEEVLLKIILKKLRMLSLKMN